jgi:hypothetical protein
MYKVYITLVCFYLSTLICYSFFALVCRSINSARGYSLGSCAGLYCFPVILISPQARAGSGQPGNSY